MKRLSQIITALVFITVLVGACTPVTTAIPEVAAPQINIIDGLGREVSLAEPAQKIVSLAPSNTEILFAVGAGEQVIGRDDFSNYPPEAGAVQTVGGSSGYNLEKITELQPDLVLAAEINSPEDVKALEELGITVFYLSNPVEFEGMYENLRTVARLTGHIETAEELIASLKGRVESVSEKVSGVETRPVVFYELDGTDPIKPWTSGPGTFITLLIEMAGGSSIGTELDLPWAQISQEQLILKDPDIILLGDAQWGTTPEMVAARPGWGDIKAVREGKVIPFNDDLVSRPGPRLVDGLEELARAIHPELY